MRILAKTTTWVNALRLGAVGILVGGVALGAGNGQTVVVPTPTPEAITPAPTAIPVAIVTPVPPPVNAIGPAEKEEAERLLSAQGYWTGKIDGTFDGASGHALIAFKKVHGMKRSSELTVEDLNALRKASRPTPKLGGHRHVEIDMDRQVLFFVDGGIVQHILPVSTGNGKVFVSEGWARRAVTPRGNFKVSRKISGWRTSPLGELYYPSYFNGGIAVHGAPSVPAYAASHGCVRVPMFAAIRLFNLLTPGTAVNVFGNQVTIGGFPEGVPTSPSGPSSPPSAPPATPGPNPPPPIDEPRTPRTPRPPDQGESGGEEAPATPEP